LKFLNLDYEMNPRILWIAHERANSPPFVTNLRNKGYEVAVTSTGVEALSKLDELQPDIAVVNAASMHTSGVRICHSLHTASNNLPILLIAEEDSHYSKDSYADVILKLPFTSRKLVNRIKPLLPSDGENCIRSGLILLDLERKRVRCHRRESSLTPRLTSLLQIFMEHPDEVMERDDLFRNVWETEYTEDTRTLDVHISWLRKAIEEDPRNPVLLVTIRGVGYRLNK
jgi:DNA-binding response OmpR family regulator